MEQEERVKQRGPATAISVEVVVVDAGVEVRHVIDVVGRGQDAAGEGRSHGSGRQRTVFAASDEEFGEVERFGGCELDVTQVGRVHAPKPSVTRRAAVAVMLAATADVATTNSVAWRSVSRTSENGLRTRPVVGRMRLIVKLVSGNPALPLTLGGEAGSRSASP